MTEEFFMNMVGCGLLLMFIVFILRQFFKDFPALLPKHEKCSYKEIVVRGIKNKEIQRRLLVTMGILLLYRVATLIPLPGLDAKPLFEFFNNISRAGSNGMSVVFGGPLDKISIFALGVMPYISACLLIQLFSSVVPVLRHLYKKEGEARKYFLRYSYILTIILCIIQSYFLGTWLANPAHFQGLSLVVVDETLFRLLAVLSLTGATLFLLWMANLITNYGIGNGIAMLILSSIIARCIKGGYHIRLLFETQQIMGMTIVLLLAFIAIFIWGVFYITSLSKRIAIDIDSREKIYVPFRLSIAGTIPIALAYFIYTFPFTLVHLTSHRTLGAVYYLMYENILFRILIEGLLIIAFSYCYLSLLVNSTPLINMLARYSYIADERNEHIKTALRKPILDTAIILGSFLTLIFFLPYLIRTVLHVPHFLATLLGSSSLIIAIGVIYDLLKQIEAKLLIADSGKNEWDIAYSAFDEIEASIKSSYLEKNNIGAVVEPLRFTWGLPIKTAVDEYRIYVERVNLGRARQLLKLNK